MRPSFSCVMRLSGSVGETHSSFETFLFFRFWSKRRTSSSVGSCSGSIAPSSRISRVTYCFQSSPVSRRTMLFMAALASKSVLSTPTVLPESSFLSAAIESTN